MWSMRRHRCDGRRRSRFAAGGASSSLRAQRSNPFHSKTEAWIASSLTLLAMTARAVRSASFGVTWSALFIPKRIVIPAQAGIQYAAASRFNHRRLWNTGSPGHRRAEATPFFERLCRAMTAEYVFAIPRRIAPELCQKFLAPSKSEGAGNAGCALHPRSRVQKCRKTAHEQTGSAEAIRHSLRNGLTAYIVLPGEPMLSCHRCS